MNNREILPDIIRQFVPDTQEIVQVSPHIFKSLNLTNKLVIPKPPFKTALLIDGPSGAGKNAIASLLNPDQFTVFRSSTSREKRPGEPDDAYYWRSMDEMRAIQESGGFLEVNEYDHNLYGTARQDLEDIFESNRIPVLCIDPNGVQSLFDLQQEGERSLQNVLLLNYFITPPSVKELMRRIILRDGKHRQNPKTQRRIKQALLDIQRMPEGHFLVINNDKHLAAAEVEAHALSWAELGV